MTALAVHKTAIPGLFLIDLPVHGDSRGWFKENWQREKMNALGLPDFGPVQQNVSYNSEAGVTRGIHAEPWDKLIGLASGRVYSVWVDLREGPTFGTVVTAEFGPELAAFVPAGVGNSYQALEPHTTYSYLVNDHWSAAAKDKYTFLNLADETINITWPVPLDEAILSDADLTHPRLADVVRAPALRTIVTGANGQLGRALREHFPAAEFTTRAELDVSDPASVAAFDFENTGIIINAAAWTAVDAAESTGHADAWRANAAGPALLARAARASRATLVHISSDYVFDGTTELHTEDEPIAPLGSYGASKAAGDAAVAMYDKHYILRTSWVIGEGNNFVRTMASLADRGISPAVVDDQFGRLTFASEIARAIAHLTSTDAPNGTYNISSDGPIRSWFDIAARVFELVGAEGTVSRTDTSTYGEGKNLAPRPRHSAFDLTKIRSTGFTPADGDALLSDWLATNAR